MAAMGRGAGRGRGRGRGGGGDLDGPSVEVPPGASDDVKSAIRAVSRAARTGRRVADLGTLLAEARPEDWRAVLRLLQPVHGEGANIKTLKLQKWDAHLRLPTADVEGQVDAAESHLESHSLAEAFFGMVAASTVLTRLEMRGVEVGDEGAEYLARAVAANSTLTALDVGFAGMGEAGCTRLSAALQDNATLKVLTLAGNGIGAGGLAQLSRALESNTSLMELDLSESGMTGADMGVLSETGLPNVTRLHLSGCKLGPSDGGVDALAAAIARNTALKSIHLSNCFIDDAGAEQLAAAIATHDVLRMLELRGNRIRDVGAEHLARAIESNATLTNLDLHRNNIHIDGVNHLARALTTNTTLLTLRMTAKVPADTLARLVDLPKTLGRGEARGAVVQHLQVSPLEFTELELDNLVKNTRFVAEETASWHHDSKRNRLVLDLQSGEQLVSVEATSWPDLVGRSSDGRRPDLTFTARTENAASSVADKITVLGTTALSVWDYISDLLVLLSWYGDESWGLFALSAAILVVATASQAWLLAANGRRLEAALAIVGLGAVPDTIRTLVPGCLGATVTVDLKQGEIPLVPSESLQRLTRLEALTEAAPQLLLQSYVALQRVDALPLALVASLLTSMVSLSKLLVESDRTAFQSHAALGNVYRGQRKPVVLPLVSTAGLVIVLYRVTAVLARLGIVALFAAAFEQLVVAAVLPVSAAIAAAWWLGVGSGKEMGPMGWIARWAAGRDGSIFELGTVSICWLVLLPWFGVLLPISQMRHASSGGIPTGAVAWISTLVLTMLAFPGAHGVTMPVDVQTLCGPWSFAVNKEGRKQLWGAALWGVWFVFENVALLSIASTMGDAALAASTDGSATASARYHAAVVVAWILLGLSGILLFPAYLYLFMESRRFPWWPHDKRVSEVDAAWVAERAIVSDQHSSKVEPL